MTSHRESPEKSTRRHRGLPAAILLAALAGLGPTASASDTPEAPVTESATLAQEGSTPGSSTHKSSAQKSQAAESKPPATQPEGKPAPGPGTTDPKSRAADIFTPSEEISEDLSVPFPVDI